MELLDSINALLQMAGLPPLPQDTTEANVSERLAIIVEAAAQSAAVADGTVAMTNLQSRLRPGAKIRSLNLQAAKARARIGRQAPQRSDAQVKASLLARGIDPETCFPRIKSRMQ